MIPILLTGALVSGVVGWYLSRTESGIRARVAAIARSQVGVTTGERYFAEVIPTADRTLEWCGIFALWVLHKAIPKSRSTPWIPGLGFLGRSFITQNPQVGDIAYFTKNQHQAIIVGVSPTHFQLVNGNGKGGAVTLTDTPRSSVTAVYSIKPWITQ